MVSKTSCPPDSHGEEREKPQSNSDKCVCVFVCVCKKALKEILIF